jgi:hypothetical protein
MKFGEYVGQVEPVVIIEVFNVISVFVKDCVVKQPIILKTRSLNVGLLQFGCDEVFNTGKNAKSKMQLAGVTTTVLLSTWASLFGIVSFNLMNQLPYAG